MNLNLILKEAMENSVIWEVRNIKKAIICENGGVMTLRTEGVNIPEMFKYNHMLDLKKLYCNDVYEIMKHYGIEFATEVIKKVSNSGISIFILALGRLLGI